MSLQDELKAKLNCGGADLVHFVDISQLPDEQNRGFANAILIGVVLSPEFIQKITMTSDYVEIMTNSNQIKKDEFYCKEAIADQLADNISDYLITLGYNSYSQSEANLLKTGFYDEKTKSTPLPHKTIALLSGMGWIGKNDLFVTKGYGSAVVMSTVLTNAPLEPEMYSSHNSECFDCEVCESICELNAIKGKAWERGMAREDLVDVYECNTCLMCLAHCPWTQRYMKRSIY